MGLVVNVALLMVSLLAVAVSVFSANFAKRQADAARDQARLAVEQAEAARQQVAEAKRANDLTEAHYQEQRSRSAVVWSAEVADGWKAVRITNEGFDTARGVLVLPVGTTDDWDHIDWEREEGEDVPPNESISFPLDGWPSPPERLWVSWDGAVQPTAVKVKRGQSPHGRLLA